MTRSVNILLALTFGIASGATHAEDAHVKLNCARGVRSMHVGKRVLSICAATLFAVAFGSAFVGPAAAQEDRYPFCQRQAERVSGYTGPAPQSYRGGEVIRGAARGAAIGALFGALSRKEGDTGRAARGGAKLGAIIGGIRRARQRQEEDRSREAYHYEISRCMAG